MRKFLLLCISLAFTFHAQGQKDTVFYETFDPPSGADSVTSSNGKQSGTNPVANSWSTTTAVAASGSQSYHVQGVQTNHWTAFETDPFSTVGKPFVWLTFNHIAKIHSFNQARIQISTDGGQTWRFLKARQYAGDDQLFQSSEWFNTASHVPPNSVAGPWQRNQAGAQPNNNWWIKESFDLTGIASDTAATPMTGYPDVRLRFYVLWNYPPTQIFQAGWFVDDVLVTAGTCEVTPPKLDFDYNPMPFCYPVNPQGPIVANIVDSTYTFGIRARDNANQFDTGVDSVVVYYKVNGGPLQSRKLPYAGPPGPARFFEYRDSSFQFSQGDVIEYYFRAWDLGCPNEARMPPRSGTFYQFHIEFDLPQKCGNSNCGKYPEVIDGDSLWIENFDDAQRWMIGPGTTPNGLSFPNRGLFPSFPRGAWTVLPQTANSGTHGFTVGSGSTPTSFTGPESDHTAGPGGGGQYIYFEATGSSALSFIQTPCIDLTQSTTCKAFEFYYHMFGSDIGNLYVAIDTGSDSQDWWLNYRKISGEQQSSSSDPWKRAVVPLGDYNGEIIRVGLVVVPNGSGTRGDIAIDDFRIYEPPQVEMQALENTLPVNGYCAYGMEPVTISLRNNGCQTMTNIPIAYSVNGGPAVTDVITNANLILGQDTLEYVFDSLADLSSAGIYDLKIWVDVPGDDDRSNDTVFSQTIEYTQPIDVFPYVQDFEAADPATNDLGTSDIRFMEGLDPNFFWKVGNGLTETRGTGPFAGHYFDGNYLHVETNNPGQGVVSAYFRTICVNLNGLSNPHLDFLYHNLTDAGFDKLVVEVSMGDEDLDTWAPVAGSTVSSKAGFNNEFSEWKLKRVDLTPYIDEAIKLRFRADRTSTTSDEVNFAIDNITIYDLLLQDAGALDIQRPLKRGTLDTAVDPQVTIINYGTSTLNGFDVNLEVTPLCGPNAGQSAVYSQSYTNTLAPEQTTVVTMDSPNIDWPDTECRVCFSTSVPGDSYAFNDTVCKNIVVQPEHAIVTQPMNPLNFSDNFDDCDYSKSGFFPDGGLLQWELGTPSFGISARSQPNAWVTNLDGPYLTGTTEYLYLPRFYNFDTIVKAEIRFWHRFNFGSGVDGVFDAAGTLQFFHSGDNAYKVLGSDNLSYAVGSNDPERGTLNWWLSQYGTTEIDLFNDEPGWINESKGRYIYSRFNLGQFNYADPDFQLDMRFMFKSKEMNQGQATFGWGIDNFSFYVPPQNSVSPINVHTETQVPFPGEDQRLRLRFRNTGAKVVDNFKYDIYVDGVHLGSQTWNDTSTATTDLFIEGKAITDWFDQVWPANLVTPGPHEVCIITSRPNGKQDNYVPDDTLCKNLPVLQEYDLTGSGDSSYCNDFEGTNPNYYPWISAPAVLYSEDTSSWEQGISVQFDDAPSGSQMWMTELYWDYEKLDASALYTPLFYLDSGRTYRIDFWHQFYTEKYHDGGNVEMSFDGGENWYYLGYANRAKENWYNTTFVTALDQIKGGWTDSSGGWQNAWWRFAFKEDVKVVFRYRFASDYALEYPGWAIDDFCLIRKDYGDPKDQPTIGGEEFVLPEEIAIGELSPNPAQDKTELPFNFPTPNHMNVKVYNVVGQLIEERSQQKYQEGIHKLSFDTSGWKNGIYLINLEYGDGQTVTRKLVVSH